MNRWVRTTLGRRRLLIASTVIALILVTSIVGHRADDWSRFDHQVFQVSGIAGNDLLRVTSSQSELVTIRLAGIVGTDYSGDWLQKHVVGQQVTLLLQTPQSRDDSDQLQAFAYLGDLNINAGLVKEGLAYADRRVRTAMDGLIDPAESEARKKKRGLWASLTFNQMPEWRKKWLQSLSHSKQ